MEWSPSYCLTCEKQIDADAYCSEICRLASSENVLNASSKGLPTKPLPKSLWHSDTSLENGASQRPDYSLSNLRTDLTVHLCHSQTHQQPYLQIATPTGPTLESLASQLGFFSIQTSTSLPRSEPAQLSESSKTALRDYASSFDQSRYQRRQ